MIKQYFFDDANHAMAWSTEVLRFRRFPKANSVYRKIEDLALKDCGENDNSLTHNSDWCRGVGVLPNDSDDKLDLALKVYELFESIDDEMVIKCLHLYFWGDYHSKNSLANVLKIQHIMRQRFDKRVRISYRYSFNQISKLLKIDHKTAAKKVRKGLRDLEYLLQKEGLSAYNNFSDDSSDSNIINA